jgi:flagellar hook-length control protein FliK
MATRLRHAGARPEQVKRVLERAASNGQPVQETHSELEGQNLKIDQDIQTLLAKLQPRDGNHQTKNGQLVRPGKTMPEPPVRAASGASAGLTEKEQPATATAKVAATVLESQQKIQEEMAKELRGNRLQATAGNEQGSKAAAGKGTISYAVASGAAEAATGAKAQAVSVPTSPTPQSPTTALEPQFQVAQRFVTMTENGESRTRLSLRPPELGRIQIDISLESNRLSATLVTETQVVKELLEAHLGQLRQHLAQHSLHLEEFQVTVGTDASAYKESNPGDFGNGKHRGQGHASEPIAADVEQELRVADRSHLLDGAGRIDLFA